MAKKRLSKDSIAFEMLNDYEEQPKAEAPAEPKPKTTAKTSEPKPRESQETRLYKETKSKHLQLLIKPSTFTKLKQASAKQGQSVNEYINNLLETTLGE